MKISYIVRKKNNSLLCFYHLNSTIFYKIYEYNRWSDPNILITNTLENFTLSILDEVIYIFYQNIDGDVLLYRINSNFDIITDKHILKRYSDTIHTTLCYPLLGNENLCLLYNVVNEDKSLKLKTQILEDDKISCTRNIDNFFKTSTAIFQVQHVSNNHILAFYQLKSLENNIGYKEITSDKTSSFMPIYRTSYQIIDYCFLTTNDCIHSVCIIKNMFSYQLVYRKKEGNIFTSPKIIWECQNIQNCLLSIINNNIYVTFMYNNKLYLSISQNNGLTFTRPELYKNKICIEPKKAIYISEIPMSYDNFFIREIYVDSNNPWDIQIIPDLYEDFYTCKKENQNTEYVNNYENSSIYEKENENIDYTNNYEDTYICEKEAPNIDNKVNHNLNNKLKNINDTLIYRQNFSDSNKINFLKQEIYNEIDLLKKEILERGDQIKYMKEIINRYKSEKSELELEKVNFNKELNAMKNKIIELENKNKDLEDKVNSKKSTTKNKSNTANKKKTANNGK